MFKRKNALVQRVTSAVIAATLATTLIPAAGLAYAADEATNAVKAAEQKTTQTQPSENATSGNASEASQNRVNEDVAITGESTVSGENTGEAAGDATQNPTDQNGAQENAQPSEGAGASGQVNYVTDNTDRISVDVPTDTDEEITVGDIEYNGLTYRINPDGQTASLIGLGSNMPAATLSIPSRITAGNASYEVNSISAKNIAGGGSKA